MKYLPESITSLLEYPEPLLKPIGPVYPWFGLFVIYELSIRVEMQDFPCLLAHSLTKPTVNSTQVTETQTNVINTSGSNEHSTKNTDVPVWSGYNSLIGDAMTVPQEGPPLIPAPPHEWQTSLTVVMQAQDITTKVVGPEKDRYFA